MVLRALALLAALITGFYAFKPECAPTWYVRLVFACVAVMALVDAGVVSSG